MDKVVLSGIAPEGSKVTAVFKTYNDKAVVCYLKDHSFQLAGMPDVFRGRARCHPKDVFDQKTGEEMALKAALKQRDKVYNILMEEAMQYIRGDQFGGANLLLEKLSNRWGKIERESD